MGIYDRDYYREERPPGVQLGMPQSVTVILILINVAVLVVSWLFAMGHQGQGSIHWFMEDFFAVTTADLLEPWMWWKFLTAGFGHDPTNVFHIFFNMFGLFIFGRAVEPLYSRREFLLFYLTSIVVGTVFSTVRAYLFGENQMLLGASGAVSAVMILFVMHYWNRTILLFFAIPAPAWVLVVIFAIGNLYTAITETLDAAPGKPRTAVDVHLVGAAFAFLYFKTGFRFTSLGFGRGWLRSLGGMFRRRPSLRVHDPDDYDQVDEGDLDLEADRLLEKVHREGEASLTARERQMLEDYSRRMRQKRR